MSGDEFSGPQVLRRQWLLRNNKISKISYCIVIVCILNVFNYGRTFFKNTDNIVARINVWFIMLRGSLRIHRKPISYHCTKPSLLARGVVYRTFVRFNPTRNHPPASRVVFTMRYRNFYSALTPGPDIIILYYIYEFRMKKGYSRRRRRPRDWYSERIYYLKPPKGYAAGRPYNIICIQIRRKYVCKVLCAVRAQHIWDVRLVCLNSKLLSCVGDQSAFVYCGLGDSNIICDGYVERRFHVARFEWFSPRFVFLFSFPYLPYGSYYHNIILLRPITVGRAI